MGKLKYTLIEVKYTNTSCTTVKSWLKFVLVFDQLYFGKVFFLYFLFNFKQFLNTEYHLSHCQRANQRANSHILHITYWTMLYLLCQLVWTETASPFFCILTSRNDKSHISNLLWPDCWLVEGSGRASWRGAEVETLRGHSIGSPSLGWGALDCPRLRCCCFPGCLSGSCPPAVGAGAAPVPAGWATRTHGASLPSPTWRSTADQPWTASPEWPLLCWVR